MPVWDTAAVMTFNWKTVIHTVYSLVSDSDSVYSPWRKTVAMATDMVIWPWPFIVPKHEWLDYNLNISARSYLFVNLPCLLIAFSYGKVLETNVSSGTEKKLLSTLFCNSSNIFFFSWTHQALLARLLQNISPLQQLEMFFFANLHLNIYIFICYVLFVVVCLITSSLFWLHMSYMSF